ncbi:hypothetical protein [Actinacidiphila acididurans]|jgi:hypothetical protein|uniref:hypothetical protein n=1 Tax=Actinacidiphila acididurans TaxID=2784346 RepID=UPI001F3A4BB5|nr:hypothetical protein [Actinacidiphila acididurans]
MGWTHDYRDVSRNHRSASAPEGSAQQIISPDAVDSRLGIPRILGRRARWMGARLRHARD